MSAEFYQDPYPFYHALRKLEPIKKMPDGSYFLTRYEDIQFVYKNPKLFNSNQLGNRISTAETEIAGMILPAQTQITLCIGAANRDPERFPEPDKLDIQRTQNRHLAFGSWIHQCVGLNLARIEGRIAIRHFLKRYPNYCLASPATRGGRARFRGFLNIPCYLN